MELHVRRGRIGFLEEAQGDAGGLEQKDVVAVGGDDRQMACVVDFYFAARCCLAADDRYVVSGEDLFADGSVDVGDDQAEGNAHGEEVAKQRVNLGHQQRGGYALSGDVAEKEVE